MRGGGRINQFIILSRFNKSVEKNLYKNCGGKINKNNGTLYIYIGLQKKLMC